MVAVYYCRFSLSLRRFHYFSFAIAAALPLLRFFAYAAVTAEAQHNERYVKRRYALLR